MALTTHLIKNVRPSNKSAHVQLLIKTLIRKLHNVAHALQTPHHRIQNVCVCVVSCRVNFNVFVYLELQQTVFGYSLVPNHIFSVENVIKNDANKSMYTLRRAIRCFTTMAICMRAHNSWTTTIHFKIFRLCRRMYRRWAQGIAMKSYPRVVSYWVVGSDLSRCLFASYIYCCARPPPWFSLQCASIMYSVFATLSDSNKRKTTNRNAQYIFFSWIPTNRKFGNTIVRAYKKSI